MALAEIADYAALDSMIGKPRRQRIRRMEVGVTVTLLVHGPDRRSALRDSGLSLWTTA